MFFGITVIKIKWRNRAKFFADLLNRENCRTLFLDYPYDEILDVDENLWRKPSFVSQKIKRISNNLTKTTD